MVTQSWPTRVGANSLPIFLAGTVLIYWGFVFPRTEHFVAPLLSYRLIAHHIFGLGVLILLYGLFTLVRRKGDFDDFDRPDDEGEDDLRKESRNQK